MFFFFKRNNESIPFYVFVKNNCTPNSCNKNMNLLIFVSVFKPDRLTIRRNRRACPYSVRIELGLFEQIYFRET